jgi:ribosomal-protein-alanine N-acetyltransferase
MLMMKIRPYTPEDKDAVITLFRQNTPLYFSPTEEVDLLRYLEYESEQYFIVEINGKICASGGYNYMTETGTCCIAWDMVSPENQHSGIGSSLLLHRIAEVQTDEHIHTLVVRTSQLVFPFYEKHGFILHEIITDYWARGFDLYRMQKSMR